MIKLIIFDLDGVLVDSKEHHFNALNNALLEVDSKYSISKKDHLTIYDGLPTKKKLELLTKHKGLSTDKYDFVWKRKQELTFDIIKTDIAEDTKLIELFKKLKSDGIRIWICSNSIRDTIKLILLKKGLIEYVDSYISNEDVNSSKPHPEMYWKAMMSEKVLPSETIIVEDSYVGRTAAIYSGAKLCPVKNPDDLTIQLLYSEMEKPLRANKWSDKTLNVLIPMAGRGSRFSNENYKMPKPLIEINGKPMIKVVVDNLNVEANFIFIVQKKHYEEFNLQSVLNFIQPNCKIIQTDGVTEGAACTTLLAKEFINTNSPLLIANSDQFMEWNSGEFFHTMNSPNIDGGILTFESNHPKWSYARLDDYGNVCEIKEKEVISNYATCGIYYFNRGGEYVKYAEKMIKDNIRVNGEFYVAPVYNQFIKDNKNIKEPKT